MKRFFVDKIEKPYLTLRGEERRHLADVLRAREGDRVVLCPNDGRDYVYEAVAFDRDSVRLKYIEDFKNETEPTLELTAYISLLKGDKTELAVQKLTELGVHRIVPFVSEYTVRTGEKSDRLRRAAHTKRPNSAAERTFPKCGMPSRLRTWWASCRNMTRRYSPMRALTRAVKG